MDDRHTRLLTLLFLFVVLFGLVVLAYFWHPISQRTVPPPEPIGREQVHIDQKPTNFSHLPAPAIERRPVFLAVVGDIMLSRVVADKIIKNGQDYPFQKAASWLESADIVLGNLETPLTDGRRVLTGEMVFRADPDLARTLKGYNFSVLSLANNHTMNFGEKGMLDTIKYLSEAGISYVGAGANYQEANSPVYLEVEGLRFAFLAYNDSDVVPPSYEAKDDKSGTAFMDTQALVKAVAEAKEKADFVIVSMHSGNEYEDHHNKRQEDFAHAAIDAGAELVLGHHAHVIQDIELYKDKYIFYGLGNFIFDQMWSLETRHGLGVKFSFDELGVNDFALQPFIINDYSQPEPLFGEEAGSIVSKLAISRED